MKSCPWSEVISSGCEIKLLFVTATQVETRVLHNYLKPLPGELELISTRHGAQSFFLGVLGAYPIVHLQCAMGSSGRDGSLAAITSALHLLDSEAVIMTGISFGRSKEKQKFGDVLVASSIASYELARVGSEIIHRGPIAESGPVLLDRFRNCANWVYRLPDGADSKVHIGTLLSGEKLVDSSNFKASLFKAYPSAIGGEMEGAGLYAAGARAKKEWILIKAIADWGDGTKTNSYQEEATKAAVSLCQHVLSDPFTLTDLGVRPAGGAGQGVRKREPSYGAESYTTAVRPLPKPTPVFINRHREMAVLRCHLESDRFVCLVGPPGVGKTEIAKQLAEILSGEGSQFTRTIFADLQGVSLPGSLISILAEAIGINRATNIEEIARGIATEKVLVVLDNLEWALRIDPGGTRHTLKRLHDLTIRPVFLATSRMRLGLIGYEQIVKILPLPPIEAEELLNRLCVRQGKELELHEQRMIPDLLMILDGLPLAIVLASDAISDTDVDSFLRAWKTRKTGILDIPIAEAIEPSVEDSLKFSISLSMLDLPKNAVETLQTLAFFPTGAPIPVLREIYCASELFERLRLLSSRSLTYQEGDRVKLLVPIREYALELCDRQERAVIADLVLSAYQPLATQWGKHLLTHGGAEALRKMMVEAINIHFALDELLDYSEHTRIEEVMMIVGTLGKYYRARGTYEEGHSILSRSCSLSEERGAKTHLPHLWGELGNLARATVRLPEAETFYRRSIEYAVNQDLVSVESTYRLRLGDIYRIQGRYGDALKEVTFARSLIQNSGVSLRLADAIECGADILRIRGYLKEAWRDYEEALSIYERVGGLLGKSNCHQSRGDLLLAQESLIEAEQEYIEAGRASALIGDMQGDGNCLLGRGRVAQLNGSSHALDLLAEAVQLFEDIHDELGRGNAYLIIGDYYRMFGDQVMAIRQYTIAGDVFRTNGCRLNTLLVEERIASFQIDDKHNQSINELESLLNRELAPEQLHKWPIERKGGVLHEFS